MIGELVLATFDSGEGAGGALPSRVQAPAARVTPRRARKIERVRIIRAFYKRATRCRTSGAEYTRALEPALSAV
jgi:hypothetical protein